jgi:hypothetical protein
MSGVRAQNREGSFRLPLSRVPLQRAHIISISLSSPSATPPVADPSLPYNSLAPHPVDKNHPTSSTPTVEPVKINRSQPQKRPLEDVSKVRGRKKTRSDLFGGVGTSEGQQAIDLTDDNHAEEVGEGKGKGRSKAEKQEEEPIEEFDDEEYGPSAPPARLPVNAAPLANIPKKPKAKRPPSSPPPQMTIPSPPNKATPSASASRSSHAPSSSRPLKSPTNRGSHHSYTLADTPSLLRSRSQSSAHSSHTAGPSGGRQPNLTPNAQPNQSTSYDAHSSQRRNLPLPDQHALFQSTPHPNQQPSSRQPPRPFQYLHLNLQQCQQQQQTQSSNELRRAEQASPSIANTPNPYPDLSNSNSKPRLVQNEANDDDEVEFVASGHSENGAGTSGKGKGKEGHVQDQIKQFNGRAGSISDSTTTSKPKPIPPSKKLKAEAGQMPLNFGPLVNAGLAGGMKGRDVSSSQCLSSSSPQSPSISKLSSQTVVLIFSVSFQGKSMQPTSSKPSNPASRRESSSSNPKPSHRRSPELSVPDKLEFPLQQVWVGCYNQDWRGLALWLRPSGFHLMQDGGETRLTIPWHDLRAVRVRSSSSQLRLPVRVHR